MYFTFKHPLLYIIPLFVGIVVIVSLLYDAPIESGVFDNSLSKTHFVELQEDGFYPHEIIITEGDSVTFTTTRGKDFWPASDPHPTHEYLGGFDPGRTLSSVEEWVHTFNDPGTWRYHDHLSTSFRGEIQVLEKTVSPTSYDTNRECDGPCFDALIRETVKEKGIDSAYAVFQEAFISGTLPRGCHWTAHQIGEEAYELFKGGVEFPITNTTSYCGYGFYHGFLEGLLRENPDIDYALSFCEEVERQLGDMGLQNCYHGIGHGFTEDPPDPKVLGDFEKMISPGIKVCEFLFKDSFRNLNLCLTGVFTVPIGFAANGEFGLLLDPEDPFALCRTQPYRYQKACYGEIAPKLDAILDWDLSGLPRYLENITDDKIKQLIVWVVPAVMMARDILEDDHTSYIIGCRENFSGKLQDICFGGTVLGFFSHGIPGEEYRKALEFCKSDTFTSDERDLCYAEAFTQIDQRYITTEVDSICSTVGSSYQSLCKGKVHSSVYSDPSFDDK